MKGYTLVSSKNVLIGDTIRLEGDPTEAYTTKHDTFRILSNDPIKIVDITILPNGGYYFIFGNTRESIYIQPDSLLYKKISLKQIFKKL